MLSIWNMWLAFDYTYRTKQVALFISKRSTKVAPPRNVINDDMNEKNLTDDRKFISDPDEITEVGCGK